MEFMRAHASSTEAETTVWPTSFGGYKLSGVGREGAVCTLEEMTQQKMISFKGILN